MKPRRREIIIAPTGSTPTQTAACASCTGATTRRAFDLTISPQARRLTTFVTGYEVGEDGPVVGAGPVDKDLEGDPTEGIGRRRVSGLG